jgi:hypothetical protein
LQAEDNNFASSEQGKHTTFCNSTNARAIQSDIRQKIPVGIIFFGCLHNKLKHVSL